MFGALSFHGKKQGSRWHNLT